MAINSVVLTLPKTLWNIRFTEAKMDHTVGFVVYKKAQGVGLHMVHMFRSRFVAIITVLRSVAKFYYYNIRITFELSTEAGHGWIQVGSTEKLSGSEQDG